VTRELRGIVCRRSGYQLPFGRFVDGRAASDPQNKSIEAGIGAKGAIQSPPAAVPTVVQGRVGTREAEL
jgi:hypothetical protein